MTTRQTSSLGDSGQGAPVFNPVPRSAPPGLARAAEEVRRT